jgi:hypothetical protein
LGARAAAEEAAAERQAVLQQNQSTAAPGAGGDREGSDGRPAAGQRHGGGNNGGGIPGPGAYGGKPVWKSYSKMKNLGRQAEATLEMMYSRTQVRCGSVQHNERSRVVQIQAGVAVNTGRRDLWCTLPGSAGLLRSDAGMPTHPA